MDCPSLAVTTHLFHNRHTLVTGTRHEPVDAHGQRSHHARSNDHGAATHKHPHKAGPRRRSHRSPSSRRGGGGHGHGHGRGAAEQEEGGWGGLVEEDRLEDAGGLLWLGWVSACVQAMYARTLGGRRSTIVVVPLIQHIPNFFLLLLLPSTRGTPRMGHCRWKGEEVEEAGAGSEAGPAAVVVPTRCSGTGCWRDGVVWGKWVPCLSPLDVVRVWALFVLGSCLYL